MHAEQATPGPQLDRDLLATLPDKLRQPTFERTGGLHATGLFDPSGELLLVREDVGRHNAMDKVVGRAVLDGLVPLQRPRPVRERAALVRAGAEGRGRRRAGAGRGGSPQLAGREPCGGSWDDARAASRAAAR